MELRERDFHWAIPGVILSMVVLKYVSETYLKAGMGAFIAYSGCPAHAVKGILGAGFIITGIFIVTAKAVSGQITPTVLLTYGLATPAVILGSRLGIWVSSFLNEHSYRKVLFVALAGMGLKLVWYTLADTGLVSF